MTDILDRIACAGRADIEDILKTVICRYNALYPDWEVTVISIEKGKDRNQKIDEIIDFLARRQE